MLGFQSNILSILILVAITLLHNSILVNAQSSPPPLPPPPPPPDTTNLVGRDLVKAMTNNSAIVVCVSDIQPMVFCNASADSTSYSGFDVEMIRNIFSNLQLNEGTEFIFKCVDFGELFDNTTNPQLPANETCDISAGGITITAQRQEEGIKFGFPYLNTGLKIAVRTSQSPMSGWRWTTPFSLNLWIIILATLIVFPMIIFFLEFGSLKPKIRRAEFLPGYEEAAVRSYWTIVGLERLEVVSLGAKIASICFAFLALLVVNTYTANLAAVLTVSQINSQIRDVSDLRGKSVVTDEVYIPRLRQHQGIFAFPLNVSSNDDFLRYLDDIASSQLSAIITDAPYLEYMISVYPGCVVRTLPTEIEPFSYGLIFKSTLNDSVIDIYSREILQLQEMGRLTALQTNFFRSDLNDCGNSIQDTSNQIGFLSLWGLWAILGGGCFIGFIVMLIARWRRFRGGERDGKKGMKKKGRSLSKLFRSRRHQLRSMVSVVESNVGEVEGEDNQGGGGGNDVEQGENVDTTATTSREMNRLDSGAARLSKLQEQNNIFGEKMVWEASDGRTLQRKLSKN